MAMQEAKQTTSKILTAINKNAGKLAFYGSLAYGVKTQSGQYRGPMQEIMSVPDYIMSGNMFEEVKANFGFGPDGHMYFLDKLSDPNYHQHHIIKTGATLFLGGLIGKELGKVAGSGKITQISSAAKKAGEGAMIGGAITAALFLGSPSSAELSKRGGRGRRGPSKFLSKQYAAPTIDVDNPQQLRPSAKGSAVFKIGY